MDDLVLLKFPKARLQKLTGKGWQGMPSRHQKYYAKLAHCYYGPFQILAKINETPYRLKLPSHWQIHNAFHVSFAMLKVYKGTPPTEPLMEDPPEFDEREETYNLRVFLGTRTRFFVMVRFYVSIWLNLRIMILKTLDGWLSHNSRTQWQ